MDMKFVDSRKGWYQERACSILASLCLTAETNDIMKSMGGAMRWVYYDAMQHHFERAVLDTLRLLDLLAHDTDFTNSANLKAICEGDHMAFLKIMFDNMDGLALEKE